MALTPRQARAARMAVSAIVRGIGAGAVLLLFAVIARVMPPGDAATFFALLTASAIINPVMLFGANTKIVKDLAGVQDPARRGEILSDYLSFFLQINMPVLLISLLGFFAFFSYPRVFALSLVSMITLVPLASLLGCALQGVFRFNVSIFIMNIANFVLIGLIVVALYSTGSLAGDAGLIMNISFAAACMVTLLLAILAVRYAMGQWPGFALSALSAVASRLEVRALWMFWISYVLGIMSLWLPQLLYYFAGGGPDYAYFAVAQRIANTIAFLMTIATFLLSPYMARLHQGEDMAELSALFARATRLMVALSLPVVLVLCLFPAQILGLFGGNYAQGAPYLVILTLSQFFNLLTGPSAALLTMAGQIRALVVAMAIAFGVGLVTIYLTTQQFGGIGYAIGAATIIVVQKILCTIIIKRRLGIDLRSIASWRK